MKVRRRLVERIDPLWLNQRIGMKLRALRKSRGLTLAEVGIGLGVSRAAVNNWELAKHQSGFLLATLYNLALFYRVPPKSLLP